MEIQSLSVCVPSKGCMNKCKFCVSRQHHSDYPSIYTPLKFPHNREYGIEFNEEYSSAVKAYTTRMEFVRDNGCNTLMFTGTCEPQQNVEFMEFIANINNRLNSPFKIIEVQTTGRLVTDRILNKWKEMGVTTIALSVNSFVDYENVEVMGAEDSLFELKPFCETVKNFGFNLRLCLNLTKYFDRYSSSIRQLFDLCKYYYDADQVTFRNLYADGDTTEAEWVRASRAVSNFPFIVSSFIEHCESWGEARYLRTLPHGVELYGFNGMSVAVDIDCMNERKVDNVFRYLVLRENGKLYTDWTDASSLLF